MPIDRNTAQYITGNPQQPTQSSAPGIWDIDEQGSAQAAGRWPLPPNVVQRSLRFNSADSTNLTRTFTATGDQTRWTWSGWVKRSALGVTQGLMWRNNPGATPHGGIRFEGSNTIVVGTDRGGSNYWFFGTTAVFRDLSAWYHIVVVLNTSEAVQADRCKIYVNGIQQTTTIGSGNSTPSLNDTMGGFNSNVQHNIGAMDSTANSKFDGYMAEVNFIDGQALTPSSFGQTDAQTGQWIPRVYSGSYGTTGFRLQFLDNSGTTATTLGKDTSGLGNNWTPNNFSVAAGTGNDSLRDVPMNYYSPDNGLGGEVIGNYCTLNPLAGSTTGTITYSNGNLDFVLDRSVSNPWVTSTFAIPTSGKWYFEVSQTAANTGTTPYGYAGLIDLATLRSNATPTEVRSYIFSSGNKTTTYATSGSAYGSAVALGDVVGAAVDMDAGTIVFYKNGVSQGTAYTDLVTSGKTWGFSAFLGGNNTGTFWVNFGQRPFAYAAPSGFKALCTQNLSAPRIGNVAVAQANDYFNTVIWSGNGSTQSPTIDFAPDLVWVKNRSSSWSNLLYDTLRGPSTGSTSKALSSNGTDAEGVINDNSTYGYLSAFNSNGFTLTAGSYVGAGGYTNTSGQNYVGWCWNAGGSTVTNTSGTITSTVRASQTAGFSVVRYTGTGSSASFGHGLGATPQIVIIKSLGIEDWFFYAGGILGGSPPNYLKLNTTSAAGPSSSIFPSLATSSVVNIGGGSGVGANGVNHVAYCFAAVPGFSAFGSYTGNGSTDGPFIYLGFRPAWIMIKRSDAIENWNLYDNKRTPYNVADLELYPNLSNSEGTIADRDFLSNGFKIRSSNAGRNASGGTYIYAAFAEIPFQFANAR